jgi:two-component system response regulator AtoC
VNAAGRAESVAGSGERRILVVEDNDALRRGIAMALAESWGPVREESDGAVALERIADRHQPAFDVVVTDLRLPGADGVEVLKAALRRDGRTGVLLMTAYGSIATAVEAMRLGAFDFIEKPFDLEQLEVRVARAIQHGALLREVKVLREERAARFSADDKVVAESRAMREAVDLARRVAPTRSTVLITGETGTGKEVVAELIHGLSERASGPFIKVNCAALPEPLLESELFGHERGAFTGADRQRIGRFEQATGGTLFLDEIGDMSAVTQAKLLRVLQDQEFHRLGGSRPLRTDARIVAATNQRLEDALREGRFREDLYFRLNVIGIHLPPLRERPEDAVALARHFLAEFSRELLRPTRDFTDAALERIRRSRWSGNVRELRNVVERCVLMSDGELIDASQIAVSAPLGEPEGGCLKIEFPPEGLSLDQMERDLVLAALEQAGHVQKDAAKLLHVTRRKLNYMIGRMGLTHPSWRRNRPPDIEGE